MGGEKGGNTYRTLTLRTLGVASYSGDNAFFCFADLYTCTFPSLVLCPIQLLISKQIALSDIAQIIETMLMK